MDSPSYSILEQIVAASTQGYLLIDITSAGHEIRFTNPAYEAMSGYRAADLVGTAWSTQFASQDDSEELKVLERALADHTAALVSLPLRKQDGSAWLAYVAISHLQGTDEALVLIQVTPAADEAQPKVSTRLLQQTLGRPWQSSGGPSRTDASTGLLAEEHFMSFLGRDLAIARRNKTAITLMMFEVDELDVYRQTFGRNAADSCLRMIATQLTGTFGRASDLCVRLEGKIFAVSIQGQGTAQANLLAARVAEKTRNLGLHNPRGRSARHLSIRSVVVEAEIGVDDALGLLNRGRQALRGDTADDDDQLTGSS